VGITWLNNAHGSLRGDVRPTGIDVSPDIYLAIQNDENTKDTARRNIAIMRDVRGAHDEIFWKILTFKNGGYMLLNVANGTDWHLRAEDPDTVWMTNNITGEQDNQKFYFTPALGVSPIDNATFSSVQVDHTPYIYNSCSNPCSYLLDRIHL
jgi:hypothetical protein